METPTPNISEENNLLSNYPKLKENKKFRLIVKIIFGVLGLLLLQVFFIGGLKTFPEGKIVYLKKGMGLKTMALSLGEAGVVPSASLLTILTVAMGGENKVVAGTYYFTRREGVLPVALRLIRGDFNIEALKITFPEGFTVKQVGERLKANLPLFDLEKFIALAKDKEGYLFPNTYFFLPDVTPEIVLESFSNAFNENMKSVKETLIASKKTESEIINMASILEKEVKTLEDKKIVAGILYKRIAINMPLQVDATLTYERGLTSAELSTADLRKTSPYNTYTNQGLPPTPIGNPGLNSIKGALEPTKSDYLYFLTDEGGIVHYAKTFAEHVANKTKYIKK